MGLHGPAILNMTEFILLFPGQGSQVPGMGQDLAAVFPQAREVFDQADALLDFPISTIAFSADADELRKTRNAQLSLLVHAAAAWACLPPRFASATVAAAGHSVGEFAACYCAGALSLQSVLKLVDVRGAAMADSGHSQPGTMAAILGSGSLAIADLCAEVSRDGSVVVPANFNSPEQVVISGHVDAVERAMQRARETGYKRAVQLNVSGAFHSPLMMGASALLDNALEDTNFVDPRVPVYSNVSAAPCMSGTEQRMLLSRQLTSPVRWVEVMQNLERSHPSAVCLEMGPGNVLAGLAKRSAPQLVVKPCGTVKDLEQILEFFP